MATPKRFRVQGFIKLIGKPLLVAECDTPQQAMAAALKYEADNISEAIIYDQEVGAAVSKAEFAAKHNLR